MENLKKIYLEKWQLLGKIKTALFNIFILQESKNETNYYNNGGTFTNFNK